MVFVLKLLVGLFCVGALGVVALFLLGPREPGVRNTVLVTSQIGLDIDAYLTAKEERLDDIWPGVEKEVIWADAPGVQTEFAVVYIHGWSATKEELRPVPDRLAAALGANLFYTRLSGHGRTGQALADAEASDWVLDAQEALEIGRRIGKKVILFGTSTGGTLVAELLAKESRATDIAGAVLVSPNFRIKDPASLVLTFPYGRRLVEAIIGKTRSWQGQNALHTKYWTNVYPSVAVVPLAVLVKHVRKRDFAAIRTPALFIYTLKDDVVEQRETERIMAKWGGEVTRFQPDFTDDPKGVHVLAGDIISPSRTTPVADAIIAWAKGL